MAEQDLSDAEQRRILESIARDPNEASYVRVRAISALRELDRERQPEEREPGSLADLMRASRAVRPTPNGGG
jgi:hypothetical protein